jgi:hypothetical protein
MHKFISINRIFSKLSDNILETVSEDKIVEQVGEALEFMETERSFEEHVAFIEVVKHECNIPSGTQSIIQIARNNRWTGIDNTVNCITPTILQAECKAEKVKGDCTNCLSILDDAVWLDCHGQPIVEYDLAYYRPYFDLQMEYYGWSNSHYCRQNFTPVILKSHSFFNSIVCSEAESSPYHDSKYKDEYTIINRSKLRFSFECGQIAIAFNKQMLDTESGYPLIPDSISHTTAIVAYINMKKAENDFDKNREGADSRLKYWSSQWDWYCGQASNNDKMLVGVDEHENFKRQRQYMLPRDNYYNFFGKMNEPEDRFWNHRRGLGRNIFID